MVHHRHIGRQRVPFDFQNSEWKELLAEMIEGYKLRDSVAPRKRGETYVGVKVLL